MKTHSLILAAAFLWACGDSEPSTDQPARVTFQNLGLQGEDIEEIQLIDGFLFAATRSGLYRRSLEEGSPWSGPAFEHANAVISLGGGELLLSTGVTSPALHRSPDLGLTWTPVQGSFGHPTPERAFDFAHTAEGILATGANVVARSLDRGRTWTPIFGDFGYLASGLGDVHVDDRDGEIWAGGQGAIENVVLLRSADDGATWDQWPGLIGPPSTLKDIAFHPTDAAVVFAGFEEGLMRTQDDGATWSLVVDRHEDAKFFFGVEVDGAAPDTVYAGGWLKQYEIPQPMVLHISDDGGDTWTDFEGPADFGGIWDMIQVDRPADEPAELIVALQRGGVYRVRIERP